jgi:hypothetical protein
MMGWAGCKSINMRTVVPIEPPDTFWSGARVLSGVQISKLSGNSTLRISGSSTSAASVADSILNAGNIGGDRVGRSSGIPGASGVSGKSFSDKVGPCSADTSFEAASVAWLGRAFDIGLPM